MPLGPDGPDTPDSPEFPDGPLDPAGPEGPGYPDGPISPEGPEGPLGPEGPAGGEPHSGLAKLDLSALPGSVSFHSGLVGDCESAAQVVSAGFQSDLECGPTVGVQTGSICTCGRSG